MSQAHKDRLLEMIEQGLVDKDTAIKALVEWIPNGIVEAMAKSSGIKIELEYEVRVEVVEKIRLVGFVRTYAVSDVAAINNVINGNHHDFVHDDTLETEDWKIIDASEATPVQ